MLEQQMCGEMNSIYDNTVDDFNILANNTYEFAVDLKKVQRIVEEYSFKLIA